MFDSWVRWMLGPAMFKRIPAIRPLGWKDANRIGGEIDIDRGGANWTILVYEFSGKFQFKE